jgi:signal transduction histidine kinase
LKRRFLLTIGLVLALAIGSVGILQYVLFRSEQFRLIDSRIEATATLLISSELSSADLKDFDEAENIISDVVGGEKFNQFILIYKKSGQEIYRSSNAEVLPEVIPKDEKWQTIETDGHIIRVLTLPLARPGRGKHLGTLKETRILQTGLILDEDLLRMKTLSRHVIIYSLMILLVILLTTFWLAEALLRPLKSLALYLRHLSSRLEVSPDMRQIEPPVPPIKSEDDEFGQLVAESRRLRDMIGRGLKNTQAWTAQMAHEMKTPLTILQNSLETARAETDPHERDERLKEATGEVAHLNALISSFLEWSAAENYPEISEDLHAVRLGASAKELAEKFERRNEGRVRFDGDSTLRVFAKRGFVQQAISNLITNALRYSPNDSIVELRVRQDRVEIVDEGPGLPSHVVDHLGEPFNYGSKDLHGFGLGLAWVRTICRKYGWNLSFDRAREQREGRECDVTIASIRFPPEEY